jgi:hypothetical protein
MLAERRPAIDKTNQPEQNNYFIKDNKKQTNTMARTDTYVPVKQYAFVKAAKTPISLEFSNAMRDAMMMLDDRGCWCDFVNSC